MGYCCIKKHSEVNKPLKRDGTRNVGPDLTPNAQKIITRIIPGLVYVDSSYICRKIL